MPQSRAVGRVDADDAFARVLDQRLGELEQRLLQRLGEPLADLIAELRALRTVTLPAPAAPDAPHARVILALAATLRDLDLTFEAVEVIDAARLDHALDDALRGVGLTSVGAFGLWLRAWRNRPVAGYIVRRDGRGWRLERT